MDDRPEWFAPKRYGYGAGLPISWQGWALTLGYVALLGIAALLLARRSPFAFLGIVVTLSLLLTLVSARTTRGGWRWRWGEKD